MSGESNRRVLVLIAGLPLLMFLGATLLWQAVDSGRIDLVNVLGTANQGTLVEPPRPLQELALRQADGAPWLLQPGPEGTWYLLMQGQTDCAAECTELLYFTRQLRTAMGKYMGRIQRLYLLPGEPASGALAPALLEEHPDLKVLYTPATQFDDLFTGIARGDESPAYYAVDPFGWVMMYYTADIHYKDVMGDLKFLLKNSGS